MAVNLDDLDAYTAMDGACAVLCGSDIILDNLTSQLTGSPDFTASDDDEPATYCGLPVTTTPVPGLAYNQVAVLTDLGPCMIADPDVPEPDEE